MTANPDFQTQIAVIDAKLSSVIDTVGRLAKTVEQNQSRPAGISWRELGATLVTMAGSWGFVTQISDRSIHGHTGPLEYRIAKIEERLTSPKQVYLVQPGIPTQ